MCLGAHLNVQSDWHLSERQCADKPEPKKETGKKGEALVTSTKQ